MAADGMGQLEAAMNARRLELGLRWRDVADQADIAEETVRMVRKGGRRAMVRTTQTEARIERALRWERGSIQAVRDGGRAVALPGTPGGAAGKGLPLDLALIPARCGSGSYPDFVGGDPGYRAIWEIPDELLSAEERKYGILQLELLRSMRAVGMNVGA